ncbi:extracellular solute-binding protein [Cellulomonas sp. 73-145]|uniref:ABC transporter substrate-binding protein n=1 Tax=Cellulomonas sp. 73-145 TaxID=1895739 RepID=UPI000A5CC5AB|nr:extracellular solute-binding protein [Cellulomonas sp. 73-145]
MIRSTRLKVVAATALAALSLAACSSGGSSSSSSSAAAGGTANPTTLTFWHYEGDDSAMTQGWNAAIKEFEAANPGVTVKVEKQTFEQLQKNAKIVLAGNDVPDVMEYNKGNATAGQLASQGLLTDLSADAKKYGWDSKLSSSVQTTAKYDDNGLMGSGKWYGVPSYGEYVTVFYNKDMFDKYGISVPTNFADFEKALATFKQNGVTPLAEAGAEYPLGQLWYELVLNKADRSFVDNFELFKGNVDFTSGPLLDGTNTLADWVSKGYISKDSSGLKAEDMGTAFIAGKYPIMVSGSWWFGRLNKEVTSFKLGQFTFPGNKLNPGSSGNLLVIPKNSKNAALAAKFIDATLGKTSQDTMAKLGGLPVAGDSSVITDPNTKTLQDNFDSVVKNDGLAFYPDWPVAGFYDQLVSFGQTVVNGSKAPADALKDLGTFYDSGRKDLTGK